VIRLARRPQRRDNGFGLVEMMISMSIFALVMSLVVALLITAQKQTAATSIRLDDIDQARMAIDSLSRTVRTAVEPAQLQLGCTSCNGPASTSTALTSAQPASLQLFANGGSAAGPSLVTFTASYDPDQDGATPGSELGAQLHLHRVHPRPRLPHHDPAPRSGAGMAAATAPFHVLRQRRTAAKPP